MIFFNPYNIPINSEKRRTGMDCCRNPWRTVPGNDLPSFAYTCSSAVVLLFFIKVKWWILDDSRLRNVSFCLALQTVVRNFGFYYVLTTVHCLDLPRFAPFRLLACFPWHSEAVMSREKGAANCGKPGQNGVTRKEKICWLAFFLYATAAEVKNWSDGLLLR